MFCSASCISSCWPRMARLASSISSRASEREKRRSESRLATTTRAEAEPMAPASRRSVACTASASLFAGVRLSSSPSRRQRAEGGVGALAADVAGGELVQVGERGGARRRLAAGAVGGDADEALGLAELGRGRLGRERDRDVERDVRADAPQQAVELRVEREAAEGDGAEPADAERAVGRAGRAAASRRRRRPAPRRPRPSRGSRRRSRRSRRPRWRGARTGRRSAPARTGRRRRRRSGRWRRAGRPGRRRGSRGRRAP